MSGKDRLLFGILATLVGTLPTTSARGQETNPEMVPLEVVRTLAFDLVSGDADPDVLVGKLPERLERAVPLSDDARVIGSLVFPRLTVSAIEVSGDPGAIRDDWRRRLAEAGWTRPPPRSRGGFIQNRVEDQVFCFGDDIVLSLAIEQRSGGQQYVRIMELSPPMSSSCNRRENLTVGPPETLIPPLTPPDGSVTDGNHSGGGSSGWNAETRIQTRLSTSELLDHYSEQLRKSGWELADHTATGGFGGDTFRVTNGDGSSWLGLFLVSRLPDVERYLLSVQAVPVDRR